MTYMQTLHQRNCISSQQMKPVHLFLCSFISLDQWHQSSFRY